MLNKFKQYFTRKAQPAIIETFVSNGHTFKVLQPTTMSNVRKVKFFYEEYAREWGMDKQDILDFDGVILQECQAPVTEIIGKMNADLINKLARIQTLVTLRSAMIKEDFQYKPFLKAATVIILIDDEDENVLSDAYMNLKLKLCRDNPEIEAFFLRTIRIFQVSITASSDTPKTRDLPSSTSQQAVTERLVLKEIDSNIYPNGI